MPVALGSCPRSRVRLCAREWLIDEHHGDGDRGGRSEDGEGIPRVDDLGCDLERPKRQARHLGRIKILEETYEDGPYKCEDEDLFKIHGGGSLSMEMALPRRNGKAGG